MKKLGLVIIIIALFTTGCTQIDSFMNKDKANEEWDLLKESSEDTTVVFYYTKDSEDLRNWFRDTLAVDLLEDNKITLKFQYVAFETILEELRADRFAERNYGSIDLLLLHDNELAVLKNEKLLYEEYISKMPNYKKYTDVNDHEVLMNNQVDISNVGVIFGREQFVFAYDEDELESYPQNARELMTFVKNNKGKFTYPSDEIGYKFICTLLYDLVGKEEILAMTDDSEAFLSAVETVRVYLDEIEPYLWRKGLEFPDNAEVLDKLFYDGEVYFSMSDNFNISAINAGNETYPDGGISFIFSEGTIGSVNYLAVPYNSTNKTGAMTTIDYILQPMVQEKKMQKKGYMNLPGFDYTRLSVTEDKTFNAMQLLRTDFKVEELLANRYPELSINKKKLLMELLK